MAAKSDVSNIHPDRLTDEIAGCQRSPHPGSGQVLDCEKGDPTSTVGLDIFEVVYDVHDQKAYGDEGDDCEKRSQESNETEESGRIETDVLDHFLLFHVNDGTEPCEEAVGHGWRRRLIVDIF
jgi:hypothetical protein